MDWTTIITSVVAVIFGGGWLATWYTQKRENRKAANEEWKSLYDEMHERNVELSEKMDNLQRENVALQLENERLKAKIEQNTEDINDLKAQIKVLQGKMI